MKNAFTLVEIIIVVMIMSLFIGVGFNTYTTQIQTRELDRQVDAFVTSLNLARNRAISRDISPNSTCATFGRYEVVVSQTTNPPQYNLRFICTTPSLTVNLPAVTFNQMTLTGLPSTPNPYPIAFHHPYGCLNSTCNAAAISVTICNVSARCKVVSINSLGNISVN